MLEHSKNYKDSDCRKTPTRPTSRQDGSANFSNGPNLLALPDISLRNALRSIDERECLISTCGLIFSNDGIAISKASESLRVDCTNQGMTPSRNSSRSEISKMNRRRCNSASPDSRRCPERRIKKDTKSVISSLTCTRILRLWSFWVCMGLMTIMFLSMKSYYEGIISENEVNFKRLSSELGDILSQGWQTLVFLPLTGNFATQDNEPKPGQDDPVKELVEEGWTPKHPIYLIPGFTTNGLTLWQGRPCADAWFRRRIWTSITMAQSVASDALCWMQHLALKDGHDPEGISVRPVSGLEAIDYFLPMFHVWNPLITGLGRFGYNSTNLEAGNWDWRLSPNKSNERDHLFQKFVNDLELLVERNSNEPAVLVSHSYGDHITRSFIRWVELKAINTRKNNPSDHDAKSKWDGWLKKHVKTYFSLGAPMLGVPKALSAVGCGEFRDTIEMGRASRMMSDVFIPAWQRARLWRSWPALQNMIPHQFSPYPHPLITLVKDSDDVNDDLRLYGRAAVLHILSVQEHDKERTYHNDYDNEITTDLNIPYVDVYDADDDKRITFNYLRDPLTLDPETNIDFFCYYGSGIDTEAGYLLLDGEEVHEDEHNVERNYKIAMDITNSCYGEEIGLCQNVRGGMIMDPNGDGTVPHPSNSYLCRSLWRDKPLTVEDHGTISQHPVSKPILNPNNQRVVVKELVEYKHKSDTMLQNVGAAANHVDVIGNFIVLRDILIVASGRYDEINDLRPMENHIHVTPEVEYLSSDMLLDHVEMKATKENYVQKGTCIKKNQNKSDKWDESQDETCDEIGNAFITKEEGQEHRSDFNEKLETIKKIKEKLKKLNIGNGSVKSTSIKREESVEYHKVNIIDDL